MNSKLRKICSLVVAFVIAGVLVQTYAGDAAAESGHNGKLQGTWRVRVNPINCQTGAPIPSFDVLLSFARGGTLTEVINAEAFLPGQRTTGLGVWSRTGRNTYKAVWDAFILFDTPGTPPRFRRGVQRLTWDFEVDGDQMTVEATSQFFDANGNPLVATCATATGTRLEGAQDED